MKKFLNNCKSVVLLCFLISSSVFANNLDSLENVAKTGTPKEQMKALQSLSIHYKHSISKKSLQYASELLIIAQKENDKMMEAYAYDLMSIAYSFMFKSDSALLYANKSLNIFEELKDERSITETKSAIAGILATSNKPDEALKIHFECLEYYTKEGFDERKGHTLFSIGALYGDMKLNDLSMEYTLKALEVFENMGNKIENPILIGVCYINICSNYFDKEEYLNALEYAEKATMFFRNHNSVYILGKSLLHKCDCLQELNRAEEAFILIEELENIAQKLNDNYFSKEVLNLKGKILMKTKQYKKAMDCFKQSLAIIDTTYKRNKYIIPQLLAEASAYAGTPDETYGYIREFAKSVIETFSKEWSDNMTEMEVKYETEKKQLEIDRQQQIIARQNMQRWLYVGGIAVCCIFLTLMTFMLRMRINRNQVLAEMNNTKDKFFSIISHDLKNPAISMRDALKSLVKNANSWDIETLSEYYNELLKSAEGEVELIHNLLGWAQINTGRIAYKPQTVIITDFLPDITLIRKMAEKKGVSLNLSIPDSAIITGDCNIISTVLRNLLTNAIKFTPAGGGITLEITRNINAATYTFSVIDTGIGINKEQMKDLFSLFKPNSTVGTDGERGSGLGLIICKDFLEMHGSKLNVESEVGKGSRFWFLVSNGVTE